MGQSLNVAAGKLGFFLFVCSAAYAQVVGNVAVFANGTQVHATQPGAVVVAGSGFEPSIWVSYTNGASDTGGSSTVVRYNDDGRPIQQYSIPGSVDALEEEPGNGVIWALQNSSGSPLLTNIDPRLGITRHSPLPYAVESPSRGYRDVAFYKNQAFLSYTNPATLSDPTVQSIAEPANPLPVGNVLLEDAAGLNIATGATGQLTSQNDPGSLRMAPGLELMLVSRSDGQLIFLQNANTSQQCVSFLNVLDPAGAQVSGVSDALFPKPGQSLFFLTNSTKNVVLLVYIYNIPPQQLFALVDSMSALVMIDQKTGIATPVLGNLQGFERMSALQIPGE